MHIASGYDQWKIHLSYVCHITHTAILSLIKPELWSKCRTASMTLFKKQKQKKTDIDVDTEMSKLISVNQSGESQNI